MTTTTTIPEAILTDVKNLTPFRLANEADCSCPDSPTSAGSEFLASVRDSTIEAIENLDTDELTTIADSLDYDGRLHVIADNAPDYRTHTRWSEFVDLGAYNEDLSEFGDIDADDLTRAVAGVALYQIADRLVRWLCDYVQEQLDDQDD